MTRRVRWRLVALVVTLAWPLPATRAAAPGSPASSSWREPSPAPLAGGAAWIEPFALAEESALRQSLRDSKRSPESLLLAAQREPGSVGSGLARLAAAWLLVESGRAAEAQACLEHPDVARTALVDYAQFTLGLALEARGNLSGAADAYRRAASLAADRPLGCVALARAGDALGADRQVDAALVVFEQALQACSNGRARVLSRLADLRDGQGQNQAAAETYDRLEREYPASPQARASAPRLRALQSLLPLEKPEEIAARAARRALLIFAAGEWAEAEKALAAALVDARGEPAEELRVAYGRTLLARKRTRQALPVLARVPAASAYGAEAAYHLAKAQSKAAARLRAYEDVATRFRGSRWAEEALLALAAHYQKDALDLDALPYYRRLVQEHPEGRYTDRSAWRVGWGDYRASRFEDAARTWEWAARARAETYFTPGFLYWSGRARQQLGQVARARSLLSEAVQRFKRHYHGQRASQALSALGGAQEPAAAMRARLGPGADEIPEQQLARLRQLLLIERLGEAREELRALPPSPAVQATIAWIEWREGRLRPAISAMKRAFPGYLGSAGDLLPEDVLRIVYPLEHRDEIEARARATGLDPALVAALICQESTFDAGAKSSAGARGLMQVMPATGRSVARSLGLRYRLQALHDARFSLELGTAYLRGLLDRFDGRPELALAAYNAGPHRVEKWTGGRSDVPLEEFVESIPFTETRNYVMTILAAREQYRRLYNFPPAPPAVASAAGQEGMARP